MIAAVYRTSGQIDHRLRAVQPARPITDCPAVPLHLAHRAAEALLFGEPLSADAALGAGLVNKVLPASEVNAYAQAQAAKLATKPISSLVEIKRLMKSGQHTTVLQRMDDEGSIFRRMLVEPAAKEAFSAFLRKRKPDFS